jgi:hypothetical protein
MNSLSLLQITEHGGHLEAGMTERIDKKEPRDSNQMNAAQDYQYYCYYCKLCDDMVTLTPCLLRRRELNGKKDFSCMGCSKDTIMNSRHNRLSALQDKS